jgi:hypothetical protein
MSAFLCNDYHLSYIVKAGIKYKAWLNFGGAYNYLTREKAQHVFEVLKRENMRSVRIRYNESAPAGYLGWFDPTIANIDPIQTLKAINCLDYQSCEFGEWDTSLARKYLDGIASACIHELPGYEAAQWELQEPAITGGRS